MISSSFKQVLETFNAIILPDLDDRLGGNDRQFCLEVFNFRGWFGEFRHQGPQYGCKGEKEAPP